MRDANQFTEEEVSRHNALGDEAWRLLTREIFLSDRNRFRKPRWMIRGRLNKAISLLQQTLEINETGWQSMWALGKIYQRLGNHRAALGWFLRALAIESSNADVAREASLSAMDLGMAEEALTLTETAMAARPDDPGLLANHALALMLAGRLSQARDAAKRAASQDPRDRISRNVLRWVEKVAAGKTRRPTRVPAV